MVSNAFVLCKVRRNVSLSPCHAMEPRVGIDQDLAEQIMQYSERLQGVVLSFSNVQLDRPYGAIVNEMPFIHCKVLADALVFRPKMGMILRGIVNKIGSNHVGMLFAGVFNGSVSEAELPKGFVHNYAQDCWLGEDGSAISVEDEVKVKVLRVHVAGGMIAIEATMRFGVAKSSSVIKVKRTAHLNVTAEEPVTKLVKEKKTKKTEGGVRRSTKVTEGEEYQAKAEKSKKVEGVKVKKTKKVKRIEEVNETTEKKSKKRKQQEEVVEAQEVDVVVKPKKHKNKDAKKKKHKKSKQE